MEWPEPQRARSGPASRQRVQPAIKRTWLTMVTTTVRTSLLVPAASGQLRLARIWIVVEIAETAEKVLELYHGTGANAATDATKVIDLLVVKAVGQNPSRDYDALSLDRSPTGAPDEVISYRWTSAPANAHRAIVEYREHMTNRICRLSDLQ